MTGAPTGWHLELNAAACDGHGICSLCCPEHIGLDRWGYAIVDTEPIVDENTLKRARRAAKACPEGALTLQSYAIDQVRRVEQPQQSNVSK